MRDVAERYLEQQLGNMDTWPLINKEVWDVLDKQETIALPDLTDQEGALIVLALLAAGGFVKMEYVENDQEVSPQEIGDLVRAWWKEKTLSEAEWEERASGIMVQWRACG